MKAEKMKDKKSCKCPECGWVLRPIGWPGRKWRCTNPDCPAIFVENPEPVTLADTGQLGLKGEGQGQGDEET